METFTTLDRLRAYLGMEAGEDDARLLTSLESASAVIQMKAGRAFVPHLATRYMSVNRRASTELILMDDLLDLISLQNGDGTTIQSTNVTLIRDGDGPASVLMLKNGHAFTWIDHPEQAIAVNGIWGWHDNWGGAWRDSLDQLVGSVDTATETEISVGYADLADSAGESPRFQVGHVLRIDDEYMRIQSIVVNPGGADTLTVERGINGTTATTHPLNTSIDTYQPPEIIASLTVLWAAWFYRSADHREAADMPNVFADMLTSIIRRTVNGL